MYSYGRPTYEGGTHYVTDLSYPGLAWSEGWASFYASYETSSPYYYSKIANVFFWVNVEQLSASHDLQIPMPSPQALGYPNPNDPLLQRINEFVVTAILYRIATTFSPPFDFILTGANYINTLISPRMMYGNMARNYVFYDYQTMAPYVYNGQSYSVPILADYLDALRCNIPMIDPAIAQSLLSYPYPIDQDPICQNEAKAPIEIKHRLVQKETITDHQTLFDQTELEFEIKSHLPLAQSMTIHCDTPSKINIQNHPMKTVLIKDHYHFKIKLNHPVDQAFSISCQVQYQTKAHGATAKSEYHAHPHLNLHLRPKSKLHRIYPNLPKNLNIKQYLIKL
jgi:hypothetical protein